MIWNLSKYEMLPKFVITPLLFETIIHVVLCIIHLQKLIEEVEEMLNNLPGVTSVHGRFYDLSSKYYRIIGNHAMYYKDALRYLGCVEAKDLPGEYSDCWMFTFDKILGETAPFSGGPTEIKVKIWQDADAVGIVV